ncbi:hypothetical protein [Massilia sp. TWP1-3-3]|uniref:hypothetical protein n=1 Tax=Massilia sp. TWP1-3-3 TaxID=2804573 RepID=UPI003CE741C2
MTATHSFPYCNSSKKYTDKSIIKRLENFFLDNVGNIITNAQLIEVAKDPVTGNEPENWHQRLSELRTNSGYTILSKRDRASLAVGEYLMLTAEKRTGASGRVMPTSSTWRDVLARATNKCEWVEGGHICGMSDGDIDPVGGGTVKLTPDHKTPHSVNPNSDPENPGQWQALCGRHQVMKKNYWDSNTGKLNVVAIMQAVPKKDKELALGFLLEYFDLKTV